MKVNSMRKNLTKAEIDERKRIEDMAKLDTDKLIAPSYFNKDQIEVFNFIRDELAGLELLDNLDLHALERYIISYYHYTRISKSINRMAVKHEEFYNNTLLLEKYNKMARESARDLGLSLGERLKLLALSKMEDMENEDPLLRILNG